MGDFSALPGTAIVVGGTGGIGSATVRTLAERGSRVAFTYHSNEAKAVELTRAVDASACRVELGDASGVLRVVDSLVEQAGAVHTVVYAAGSHVPMRHLSTIEPDEVARQVSAGDVAEAVCFLASPRGGFITGQELDVDGGFGV